MKLLLSFSILSYLCSLLSFIRTWNSSYRYADFYYSQDIFVEGYDFPCLVIGDEAIRDIFIYYMPIAIIGLFIFSIVALYHLFKKDFTAFFYVAFLGGANIAIIIIALIITRSVLSIADEIGNICVYNQANSLPCLTLTPSFITIYSISFLVALILIGFLNKLVFSKMTKTI
ncbi:hypothetical protein N5853_01795 [Bartonella sp. HY329]|uniref:hypothetical protein n=1 Tax=unclassified Bartonella TaxID=2645622 RepID=UPI0021C61953|nr:MULTISPECIES: hypothetical protein [unclassified Bartonella]UXM95401.1 hypothetical protein N5853_01795 [Bartonella sp. HY329]UXN09726.1 hypothetical protein N5852_01800 [Bartonella sp. HY328]